MTSGGISGVQEVRQVLIFRPRAQRGTTSCHSHSSSRGLAGQGEEIRETPLTFCIFRCLHFPGVSSEFRAHLRQLVKAKKIGFCKSEASRALRIRPQIQRLARSAEGPSGFTSQGGYAEEVCFQEKHISAGWILHLRKRALRSESGVEYEGPQRTVKKMRKLLRIFHLTNPGGHGSL